MSKELSAATFDYEGIDKDVKGKLVALAGQFHRAMKDHKRSGMSLGEVVSEAHQLLAGAGRDGEFNHYAELVLGVSRTTAYNYMWTWQRFGKCSTVEHFDDGALYALASPKAPPQAANEAERLAGKGQKITLDKAKELLGKFREVETKPKPSKPKSPSGQSPPQSEPIKADKAKETAADDGPLNDEPEEDLDFEGQVKAANKLIESFCKSLVSFYEENCPKLESINYQGRYDSALAHVRACCASLRACKYHDKPCPKCGGDGCSSCAKESDFGGVTAITFRQLAG